MAISRSSPAPPPRGLKTVHHDWQETQNHIELSIATPDAVDSDGYYAE